MQAIQCVTFPILRPLNDQPNVCFKQVATNLLRRRLQIFFPVVSATGRSVERRAMCRGSTTCDHPQKPREKPGSTAGDMSSIVVSQFVVVPKELPIQPLSRPGRRTAASRGSRSDCNLDPTVQFGIHAVCPKDIRNRIRERPIEQILELGVPQDRKDLGSQQ